MTITTIIVGVLVTITGSAVDTWNRSRAELRAARQAKAMVEVMATDFEAWVTGNDRGSEWLAAEFEITAGGNPNAATLVFFTAATDRYDGEVGVDPYQEDSETKGDLDGDVSCVGYRLQWKDPIGGGSPDELGTFVLNRLLVDPKPAFDNLLGRASDTVTLASVFANQYGTEITADRNFLCENIYQFTVTFHIEAYNQRPSGPPRLYTVPVSVGNEQGMTELFRLRGEGLEIEGANSLQAVADTDLTSEELQTGRLSAVEISISVMSDSAINLLRRERGLADDADWVAKNTFNYSKLIQLPKM